MKKSEWPKGTEIQKTNVGLPKRTWEAAKIQAMREGRTLQELIAEAVDLYLRKSKKGGRNA
jgi:hypothetical protein